MRRACWIALALVPVTVACGAKPATRPTAARRTPAPMAADLVVATPAASAAVTAAGRAAPPPPIRPSGAERPQHPLDVAAGDTRKLWGDMLLEVALTPRCASPGTAMRLVVRTVPDALVGAAVRYPDGNPHGDFSWGRAPTGEFVWTWTIKPDVPPGLAHVNVTAGKSGETGASTTAGFEVKGAGGC